MSATVCSRRVILLGSVISLAAVLPAAGCSTVGTLVYLINPNDVPAEYDGLRGKHVAVVCRPIVELQFSDAGSARELARTVGRDLERNLRRTRVISQQEVVRWVDENERLDYATLGRSLDADLVVGIDLEGFRLYEGSTLYRGTASALLKVYDIAEGTVVFEKRLDDFSFPKDSAIPTSDRSEPQFRGMFIQVLAGRIARCFYPHDSRTHFAEENLTY
jgi:hypothetical protein